MARNALDADQLACFNRSYFSSMMSFGRRSKIGIVAAASIFFVQATGLVAQPRPAAAQELILRAEPLPPDAQQFMVYPPAYGVFYHQRSTGPRGTFLLQYVHRVSGREYVGPSYAFSINVERQLTPKAALDRCEGAFDQPSAGNKNSQRLNGYACAYVKEGTNPHEGTLFRNHAYAKCNYFVILSEETRLMPMPAQAPVGPLLTALDRAVAALRLGECTDDVTPQPGPSNAPAKSVQSAAPPKPAPVPVACSANFVARYLAGLANQPPARRPAPGSVVALIENGKACVAQMPAAAAPAAAPSTDSSQASMRTDGTTVYVMDGSGLIVLAVLTTRKSSAPIFLPPSVGGAAKAAESYFISHLWEASSANLPPGAKSALMNGIPMPSDLYGSAAVNAAEGAANAAESAVNWVKKNPADASLRVLSTAVNIAFPYTSFGSPMIAGAITVGTVAFVRSLGKDFLTSKSVAQKFENAANEGGNEAAKSILGDMAGGGFSKVLGDSLATAALSQGASQGVSTAYDAVTNRLMAMKDTPKSHPYNSDLVKPASAAVPHSGMRILMPANQ